MKNIFKNLFFILIVCAGVFLINAAYADAPGGDIRQYELSLLREGNYPSQYVSVAGAAEEEIIQRAVGKILAQVKPEMSDVEKLLAVHDHICQHYMYDCALEIGTAEEFFLNKRGICMAYNDAMVWILNELGIETAYVISESMGHEWIMVTLNGNRYHIDATWDGTDDSYGRLKHDYFLLSDEAISDENHKHHDWIVYDSSGKTEIKATDTKYDNYFWVGVNEPIRYYNGAWYFAYSLGDKYTHGILSYNFSDGSLDNIIKIPEKFYYDELHMCIYDKYFYMELIRSRDRRIYISPVDSPQNVAYITTLEKYDTSKGRLNGEYLEDGVVKYAIAADRYFERVDSPEYDFGIAAYPDYYNYQYYYTIDLRGYKYEDYTLDPEFQNGVLLTKSVVEISDDSIFLKTSLDGLSETEKQRSEVFAALYDENGAVIDSYNAVYDGAEISGALKNDERADHIRVFVWNKNGSLEPITDIPEYINLDKN